MAIGDSFGGVAADRARIRGQQSADYFNQIGANRAQQALDLNALQADRSFMLQQQQLGDARAARAARENELGRAQDQYALEYLTRLGDTGFNRDLQLERSALDRSYFDQRKADEDQKKLLAVDQVTNQGAALASELGDATEKRTAAARALAEMEQYTARLKASALENPQWKPRVLTKLAEIGDQMQGAKRGLVEADYLFKKATSQAANLGFVPDVQRGKLVHARTGKAFDYLTQFSTPTQTIDVESVVTPEPVQPAPVARATSPAYLARQNPQPPPPATVSPAYSALRGEQLIPLDASFDPQTPSGYFDAVGAIESLGETSNDVVARRLENARRQFPFAELVQKPEGIFISVTNPRRLALDSQQPAPQRATFPPAPPIGQRVVGQVYVTPRGPLRWMGNGWAQ